ncbi:MAG: cob(I)yrinic acid a,c-diamide adenosyltransferase [Acidimicrobiia bacterium]|nr:cob(I)yrinic acid a,c-diamide adenosyltransferase [Acidimicrobiia bacterium]
MKIYTRKGDDGTTGLFYGGRVPKDATGPTAYGDVDEAVAAIGLARAEVDSADALNDELLRLQRSLFVVAAELATAPENHAKLIDGESRVTADMVTGLENAIDALTAERGMPEGFLVPGSNRLGAALDLARAIVRRAERHAVTHAGRGGYERSLVIPYLNRLADYMFILARAAEDSWTSSKAEESNP